MNVTIMERSPGVFRLRIETKQDNGKRGFKYETIRGDYDEAEARRLQLLQASAPAATVKGSDLTTSEYLDAWIERRELMGDISASTAVWYRNMLAYVKPYIGDTPLADLTSKQVEDAYLKLRTTESKRGKTLGIRSIQHLHARLVSALGDALANGLIDRDVMKSVTKPKLQGQFKTKTLDEAALHRLMDAVSDDMALGSLIRFAVATGARRGEICGLKWDDVDWLHGTITIRRSLSKVNKAGCVGRIEEKVPKTQAGMRTIRLPESNLRELRWLFEHRISDYVFPNRDGRRRDPSGVSDQVSALLERIGLGEFTLHDVRHAHATHLLKKKMPLKAVSARLGHADVTVTLRTYAHVMPQDDEALAAEMDLFMAPVRKALPKGDEK